MVLKSGAKVVLVTLNLVANSILMLASTASSSSSSDMLYIRHGRSRVRHSNEKDHIRWGLKAFDNLTLDYDVTDGYENDTMMILFGSELWALDNGSFVNQSTVSEVNGAVAAAAGSVGTGSASGGGGGNLAISGNIPNSKPSKPPDEKLILRMTTQIPLAATTTIKKKLAKKKIMENIRKNVDKGLEYLKTHKNLEEAGFRSHELPLGIGSGGYQNDGVVGALSQTSSMESKKIQNEMDLRPSATLVASTTTTNTERTLPVESTIPETSHHDRNLPHSVPARLPIPYKQQLAAREGDTTGIGIPEKSLDTINLGLDNQDENKSLIANGQYLDGSSNSNPPSGGPEAALVEGGDSLASTSIGGGGGTGAVASLADSGQINGPPDIDIDNDDDDDDDGDGSISNIYGTTDEDLADLDEISRNNRLNLMKGRDVVTRFLQIVESQHLLGANCTAGTALNLGEGVVDQYAQDRFRIEAEVAVNRANMLTRIFKLTSPSVQASEHLLHASVLSMVEFDDDIFAAGNCFDWNQHPAKAGLFCPFAYRLPPPDQGASFAKDLAAEYHYLGNTSEWFFLARKNAEKVIARNEQYIKAFHLYSNSTSREADEILSVKYEDGRWSKPYYDCGGGNIWMLTYTVPFFGYENGTYFFKGTSGIDIDLRRVDIDQCPQRNTPGTTQPLNIFAGTDKCKQRTTMCEAITGLGFRRGSYKCVCRKGFYYPDTAATQKYFNGSILEEEYEKLMLAEESTYNKPLTYECLPCAEGCDYCEDPSPCVAALNWPMRTSILVLACAVIGLLPPAAWFTFRYQQVKVVRAASPALLRVIALGAFSIYCTTIVMYPPPSLYTCTARIWLREIGFSLTYGALMLKTWRISVIFRVRSAKAVKITDAALLKRLGVICGAIGACLLVRTIVSPPEVVVGRTADDLKAFLCKTDWWDYTFTSMEVLFLAWGVRLCIMVRKAPSEFNESRFISMAIYNEFLLTCFLNVSMLFLQSPANPDLLFIIFFCHTQLTVTLLLGLIFGSKVYIVLRSGKSQENAIGLGAKASGAKFNFRPQIRTFANPSTATSSTAQLADTKLSDQEALEEIRQLSVQLQRIQELAPPRGVAVMTISSLLDGLKTTSHQLSLKPPSTVTAPQLPMLTANCDHKGGQLKVIDKSINTTLTGDTFWHHLQQPNHIHHPLENTTCISCTRITITDCDHYIDRQRSCDMLQSPESPSRPGDVCDLSFANLKLECMCTEASVDEDTDERQGPNPGLDRDSNSHHYSTERLDQCQTSNQLANHRSDNDRNCRKFHSSCNLIQSKLNNSNTCDNHKSNDHFLICDNCKKNIVNKSIELSLDSRLLADHQRKTTSQDDISFHSTDDGGDDNNSDHQNASSLNSDIDHINNSNNTGGQKRQKRKSDKLVIDLNDRTKYTKEVSV